MGLSPHCLGQVHHKRSSLAKEDYYRIIAFLLRKMVESFGAFDKSKKEISPDVCLPGLKLLDSKILQFGSEMSPEGQLMGS